MDSASIFWLSVVAFLGVFYLIPTVVFAWLDEEDLRVLKWAQSLPAGLLGFHVCVAWWFWPIAIYGKRTNRWPKWMRR